MLSMNADHDRLFRQITSTPIGEDLPQKILDRYWRYKECCDKANVRVTEQDIAWICFHAGEYEPTVEDADNVLEGWRAGRISPETPVTVQWGKGRRTGILKTITAAGEAVLVLEGEGQERKMKPEKVSLVMSGV